ncbi:OmpH family outer membrane protein [Rhodothermus profundi]|uniref:Periplasmic chaperone for outer membrane proteins Skp n=1 Tax=Rhodothermus profundi TaxID=633813 RepID=A0A1M6PHQ2_9BACT|nr:OmpH family outer membrane protein [Rhodothermus profundi]SHK07471.1 periplasmic chaperone for outer membrane proteins Skp [Rhodothermus profundi]
MRNRRFTLWALVGAALTVSLLKAEGSLAQPLRIGYTDPDVIIINMKEYQDIQQQLQKEAQESQTALQEMFNEYQQKLERYQRQRALLSEQRRQEREQELLQLQQEIQEATARRQQQLAQREAELMQPLLERVQQVIDQVAREQNLDVVLRAQALLYVKEGRVVDITREVARRLGIQVPEDTTAVQQN